jgi:hypothetical protein
MPKITSRFVHSLAALLTIASGTAAFGQNAPSDVHAKLSLADAKTTFRIGVPIVLILEFTADRDGYVADVTRDKCETRTDEVSVSPDSGVSHWLRDSLGGGYRDYFSTAKLSGSPARIQFELNDSIRFDKPGRYSVRFTTNRIRPTSTGDYQPAIPLTTNEVSFDVEPMSAADEQREVTRLSDSIDSARDWQTQDKFARELSFLTGDPSAREKVRRFFSAEGVIPGNYFGEIYNGLFIAHNRALVLQLLEAAMRDPNTPVTSGLLGVITHLRFLQQSDGLVKQPVVSALQDPNGDPRSREIQEAYVSELAAGLAKRTGKSQITTAITVLMHLPKDSQAAGALLSEARRIVLQQFDNLTPFDHEYLLEQYWDKLRDPSLVPSLKKILTGTDKWAKAIHKSVLKRLIELAPDEARPYVIAEISDPQSFVDPVILGSLPDQTIREVDSILLNQLSALARVGGVRNDMFIKQKAALAVRYATNSIYPDLMLVYKDNVARLTISSRADLLAYLAKQNEQEVLPLIEEALNGVPPEQEFNFLPELAHLYFSGGIDAVLRKRLDSDEPEAVRTAAYLISLYGPASDEKVIEARLDRWLKEWGNRRIELQNDAPQGMVQTELIIALTRAKAWKASPERMKQLQQSCLTEMCRRNFPAQ